MTALIQERGALWGCRLAPRTYCSQILQQLPLRSTSHDAELRAAILHTSTGLFLQVLGEPAQCLLAGPGTEVPPFHLGRPGEH